MMEETMLQNNSGQGKGVVSPTEVVKKFNWGAFFLSWIWGLGNATYLPLVILVTGFICPLIIRTPIWSIINLGLCIWFGIKGNEWAWQNKRFDSVEAFHSYQKKWAIAGTILFFAGIIFSVLFVFIIGAAIMSAGSAS